MPRSVEGPWFRAGKNGWYATVNGKAASLGVKGKEREEEARKAWHRLMAGDLPKPSPKPEPKPEAPGTSVQKVIDGFLAHCEGRVSSACLRNYRTNFSPFADRYGSLKAETLTVAQAEAYVKRPDWSPSYRNGILGSLVSAFRWAEREGLISRCPIQGLRKPPKASRGAKALVSADTHQRLLAVATGSFKAFLRLLWLTGARPGEIAGLRAEDVDLSQGFILKDDHKTAHLGKSRIIFLCPEAMSILRERIASHPEGLLFPGQDGQRLTAQAIGRRMARLCEKAGLKAIAYGYRHGFATDALANGVPDAQVAELLGHSGTTMLHKHYAHLTARSQVLKDALGKVR
jgi:integrase